MYCPGDGVCWGVPACSLQIVGIFDNFPRVYAVNFFENLCPREDDAGVVLAKLEALLQSVITSGKHEVTGCGVGGGWGGVHARWAPYHIPALTGMLIG